MPNIRTLSNQNNWAKTFLVSLEWSPQLRFFATFLNFWDFLASLLTIITRQVNWLLSTPILRDVCCLGSLLCDEISDSKPGECGQIVRTIVRLNCLSLFRMLKWGWLGEWKSSLVSNFHAKISSGLGYSWRWFESWHCLVQSKQN